MKRSNNIISVCALLLAVAGCFAGEQDKYSIFIHNKSKETIYGGLYATGSGGKVLHRPTVNRNVPELKAGQCRIIHFIMSGKKPASWHLIFSTKKQDIDNKIDKNENKNVSSKKIKKLSLSPEYYEVSDATSHLKIQKVSAKPTDLCRRSRVYFAFE